MSNGEPDFKRLCPGMALGESVVQAAILTMFATVDILPAVDSNGTDVPIAGGTTGKLLEYVPIAIAYLIMI